MGYGIAAQVLASAGARFPAVTAVGVLAAGSPLLVSLPA